MSTQLKIYMERAGLVRSVEEDIIIEARGVLSSSGSNAEDHIKKYINPHLGSKTPTHVLAKEHDELPKGSSLILHKVENINGKNHVHAEDETGSHHVIPVSKLHKPGDEPKNKGHDYESKFVDRMKEHGLMPKHMSGAGSTGGTDFAVENKRKGVFHAGKVNGKLLNGETKNGTTAAMGQLTIHHTDEKGWHIPDHMKKKRPKYAKQIEKAGILDYMNKHHPKPHEEEGTSSGRAKTIEIKHPNLTPAKHYLEDHHVHVLQVGGHGTYRVGRTDETEHGLPEISGKGKWNIREKQKGNKRARTVAFHPDGVKGLNKSHINLDDDDHLKEFKKTMGHK